MTLIEQGSPRLGFEMTNRFSESAYGPNQEIARRSLIFDTPSRFAEGGVGQMAAGVGPGVPGERCQVRHAVSPQRLQQPAPIRLPRE